MTSQHDKSRLAAVWWSIVAEPDDAHARALRIGLGDDEAMAWALADRPGSVPKELARPGVEWSDAWSRWRPRAIEADPADELTRLEALGGRFLVPSDPVWPGELGVLGGEEPQCLWVSGRLPSRRAVSIVGARAATSYGSRFASDLACALSDEGLAIVSGGAFGIDIAAHMGALAAKGPTVAVMAGGLESPYPEAHRGLFDRIVESGGALVSEVPPSWRPAKWRFLGRNRLIAAWGGATVVVEAGVRSGALATARRAMEIGRPVGAVPGPVTSTMSQGCHDLIRNGAMLIRGATDVRELVGSMGTGADVPLFGMPVAADRGVDALAPTERRVYEALPKRAGTTLPRLARAAGLGERDVLTALAALELRGLVVSAASGWARAR